MPNDTVSNTKCHKQLSISCVGSAMGVYETCKGKIKKKNKTEQQEEPEILKKNSSLSAKEAFKNGGPDHIAAQTFPFRELAAATRNFGADCLLGEGGSGRVYKGRLRSTKQDVAIKKLHCNKWQGVGEFLVEESMFGLLHHPHFVNLIGYCLRGCERFLVYEYMPLGSLDEHLHKTSPGKKPLDWSTRMKVAAGVAKGLEYLHDGVNPPVMYRNLKCSNILLGEGYHPKLSDVGSAEHGFVKEDECMHVKIRVPRRNEYIDPDYATTGQLTLKSDVYSFGVLLLEIITGRKVVDQCRRDKYLVTWARSRWSRPAQVVDPMLQGQYPQRGLRKALGVAASCVDYNPYMRPVIAKVVIDLNNIASQK